MCEYSPRVIFVPADQRSKSLKHRYQTTFFILCTKYQNSRLYDWFIINLGFFSFQSSHLTLVLLRSSESFCRGSIVLKLYPIQERPSSKVIFWIWLCLIICYRPLKEIWWWGALNHFNGQGVFCSSSDLHCLLLNLSRGAPQAHAHLPCKYKRIKYKPNLLK